MIHFVVVAHSHVRKIMLSVRKVASVGNRTHLPVICDCIMVSMMYDELTLTIILETNGMCA